MGGAYSFAAATALSGVACAVPFYGVPPMEVVTKVPCQTHVATNDNWVTPAKVEKIKADCERAGGSVEICLYDTGHAFMNDTRPEAYHEKSAKTAWSRAVAFLKKHCS
jgi:carboxymethylenebutenolidase